MALSQVPAAPRAREGMNVSSERVSSYKSPVPFQLTVYPYRHTLSRETNVGANNARCAVSKTNDDRSTSLTSPRARRYAMGGEARLGVYLSPSTNYERRILEDAFDGCAPRRFFTASDVAFDPRKT